MSNNHKGQIQPQLDLEEHDGANNAKRVSVAAGTNTIGSVKITNGTDTATVASTLDSRNGLDIQHSSVASKQLLYFHSDNASHRLVAGATKDFPTDIPGGATWFDLDGYLGFECDWVDNTGGAQGATLYAIWSDDQTAYAEEFPPGGNTQAIFTTADNNVHKFIPKQGRYVKTRLVNGGLDQGDTVPNIAILKLTAAPHYFTNSNTIANSSLLVQGTGIPTDQAFIMGGPDSISSPTQVNPVQVNSGMAGVIGLSTNYTGTPLPVVQKLVTSSTQSSVTAGTTSGTLVGLSATRVGVIAYNNGQYPVYFRLNSSACTTASGGYSGIIWPGCSVQIGTIYKPYSGAVTCITPAGTGNSTISLSTI